MISEDIQQLPPSSFAFVMATGIIAIAANLNGQPLVAWTMFLITFAGFVLIWAFTIARLYMYGANVWHDLKNPSKAPGFLTAIAGTCILGSQIVLLPKNTAGGMTLWLIGGGLWLVLLYLIFTLQIIGERKTNLEQGINGTWLLATVATQSIAVLGALLAPHIEEWGELFLFFAVSCFLIGTFLYAVIITLVFYRLVFYPLPAEALTPPYWIDMGASAISAFAGANLLLHGGQSNLLQPLSPFVSGLTWLFWIIATWWIPLLLLLGLWRHVYRHVPFQYSTQYWSLVFPLGMYAACSFQVAKATTMPISPAIPTIFFYVALAAWIATLWGFISTHIVSRIPSLIVRLSGR